MISKIADDRGYVSYITEDGGSVYQHQLVALLDFAPDEVFADNRDVHHMCHFPGRASVSLDVPGALVPLRKDHHRELHTDDLDGPLSPPIEKVLRRQQ